MKKWIVIGLVIVVSVFLFASKKTDTDQPTGISEFEGQSIVVKLSPDIAMSGLKGVTEEFEKEFLKHYKSFDRETDQVAFMMFDIVEEL